MKFDEQKPTTKEAENILLSVYNIQGEASKLPGEIDANFKIKVDEKNQYILKISPENTDESELDFQQKILNFLTHKNDTLIAPKVILEATNEKTLNLISMDVLIEHAFYSQKN